MFLQYFHQPNQQHYLLNRTTHLTLSTISTFIVGHHLPSHAPTNPNFSHFPPNVSSPKKLDSNSDFQSEDNNNSNHKVRHSVCFVILFIIIILLYFFLLLFLFLLVLHVTNTLTVRHLVDYNLDSISLE